MVLDGCIEIFDEARSEDAVFTVHAQSQFTGELDLFSNRKILVSGRMGETGRVLRLNRIAFRKLLSAEPDIAEIIMRAFILRRVGLILYTQGGVRIIGDPRSRDTLTLARFLKRNGYPNEVLDYRTSDEARALSGPAETIEENIPIVAIGKDQFLSKPDRRELAHALGIDEDIESGVPYDVIVVGAGPAGLAAGVYAASEGLQTLILEAEAPGGQAGTSSKIENYLGFPTGISGQALAGRAQIQAQKFGATLAVPRRAQSLDCSQKPFALTLDCGQIIHSHAVIVASGASYRTLTLENMSDYEGAGIHYAATALEADLCVNEDVIVVGGGNSAGQAAIYLSRFAKNVHILIRGDTLAASMSDYLISRIDAGANIHLQRNSEITQLAGERRLQTVTFANKNTKAETQLDCGNVFLMIGAVPNTTWLEGCTQMDEAGFLKTGIDIPGGAWTDARQPFTLETSQPGVFAVGDVRANSVKRVESGVGEGSVCVQYVHRAIADSKAAMKG